MSVGIQHLDSNPLEQLDTDTVKENPEQRMKGVKTDSEDTLGYIRAIDLV